MTWVAKRGAGNRVLIILVAHNTRELSRIAGPRIEDWEAGT